MKVLGYIMVVYGIFVVFAGMMRLNFVMKMARLKLGKKMSDQTLIRIFYIFGALVFVGGVVILILN